MGVNKMGGGSLLIWCAVLSNLSYMWKPQYAPNCEGCFAAVFLRPFSVSDWKGVLHYENFHTYHLSQLNLEEYYK